VFLFKLHLGWLEQARNEASFEAIYLLNTHWPFLQKKKKKGRLRNILAPETYSLV